jgi:hypothetical protein
MRPNKEALELNANPKETSLVNNEERPTPPPDNNNITTPPPESEIPLPVSSSRRPSRPLPQILSPAPCPPIIPEIRPVPTTSIPPVHYVENPYRWDNGPTVKAGKQSLVLEPHLTSTSWWKDAMDKFNKPHPVIPPVPKRDIKGKQRAVFQDDDPDDDDDGEASDFETSGPMPLISNHWQASPNLSGRKHVTIAV